jgi:hypothetical protein
MAKIKQLNEIVKDGSAGNWCSGFDLARTKDNSVVMVMEICVGDNNIYNKQVKYIRKLIEDYKV